MEAELPALDTATVEAEWLRELWMDLPVVVLELLKYLFYPLFILDNGMNSISKSLTVLTPA